MKKQLFLLLSFFYISLSLSAQNWYRMHVGYDGLSWSFPIYSDDVSEFSFSEGSNQVLTHLADNEEFTLPFYINSRSASQGYKSFLDSISFTSDLILPDVKDKYKTFAIYITTLDNQSISSKETYVPCFISVDGMNQYADLSVSGRIRGRGNSTWLWYDKKPYRIKFDVSNKLLGIKKNKDWVLLANYRDVTKMMNTFCFTAAECMRMPFTTPVRYAELFINGEYEGVYQVAEQVEVGSHRVDINEDGGLLMSLDVDDGPDYQPNSGDNFYSEVYKMPVCVKYPKNLLASALDSIKREFAILENAIKTHDYKSVDSLLDIPSYISEIQLQELVFNVELSAPRSVYFFRDAHGKWTFGPAWDWDAGFDFSWENMETSHRYFSNYKKSLLGTDPYSQNGEYRVPRFFTDLFCLSPFVKQYKTQWHSVADTLLEHCWSVTQKYIDGLNTKQTTVSNSVSSPWIREQKRWPIAGYSPDTEINKMYTWLQNRISFLNDRIDKFPDSVSIASSDVVYPLSVTMSYQSGYHQRVLVSVDKYHLSQLLGVSLTELQSSRISLYPINSDGSIGDNTAGKQYGAWFDSFGDTTPWSLGEMAVFIESDDLYQWSCGLYQENCEVGDVYTVGMRFVLTNSSKSKSVDVKVTFTIGA